MSAENRTLLRKAEIAVSDFTSAGALQPAQVDRFIQLMIKDPVLLQRCTVTPMRAMKEERDKMRFANRVLKAGQEGTALPTASWAKPTLGMVTLDAQLFKAEVRITDEALEDQIERGTFKDTLIEQMAKAVGRDIEWVAINGDTASLDPVLAKFEGILEQVTSNKVNGSSGTLTKNILRDTHKALPDEFANDPGLAFFTNRQARLAYKDSLSERATGLGDTQLATGAPVTWADYPVYSVPEFPVATNLTQVLHGNPAGIMVGFYRQVKLKVGEDISAGVTIIVATLRFDVKLIEELMFSRAYDVSGI